MTDFLIIGGGIAGISAAARLSELGSVIVLEAESDLLFAQHVLPRARPRRAQRHAPGLERQEGVRK